MNILEERTREADMELLNQYRKEFDNLENERGLAKTMCKQEIEEAKKNLREHINGFKGYLF